MVEKDYPIDDIEKSEHSVKKTDLISQGVASEAKNILEIPQMIKAKVFFIRHGMTIPDELKEGKSKEEQEKIEDALPNTGLGKKGISQITNSANDLKPFLNAKTVFIFPEDFEIPKGYKGDKEEFINKKRKEKRLGEHERINQSLFYLLCEIYDKKGREYNNNLEDLMEELKLEQGSNIEFIRTELLNTTNKDFKKNIHGVRKRVFDDTDELSSKNMQVCANTSKLISDSRIKKCKRNTNYIIIGHKAIKGGVVNGVFFDDVDLNINFELGGGEIIDFDITEEGKYIGEYNEVRKKNEKSRYYRKGLFTLFFKSSNFKEIIGALDIGIRNKLDEYIQKKDIIGLQNQINKYFNAYPQLYGENIASDCMALKLFALGNLIKNGEIEIIKANIEVLVNNENVKKYLDIFCDNEVVDEIKKEILFYEIMDVYHNEILKENVDQAQKKSLDPRVIYGEDINPNFNLNYQNVNSETILLWLKNNFSKSINIIYIEGNAGSGKSFLLYYLLKKLIDNGFQIEYELDGNVRIDKVVPIYINLSGIRSKEEVFEKIEKRKKCISDLESNGIDHEIVYILDGLDEIDFKQDSNQVESFIQDLEGHDVKIIITGRKGFGNQIGLRHGIKKQSSGISFIKMNDFSNQDVNDYVNNYYNGNKNYIKKFNDLVEKKIIDGIENNPLTLSMICNTIENAKSLQEIKELGFINSLEIQSREDLYDKIVKLRLFIWNKDISTREVYGGEVHLEDRIELLVKIAFDHSYNNMSIDDDYMNRIKQDRKYKYVYGKDFESLNLLFRRTEEGVYGFVHYSFKEYLSEIYLLDIKNKEECYKNMKYMLIVNKYYKNMDNYIKMIKFHNLEFRFFEDVKELDINNFFYEMLCNFSSILKSNKEYLSLIKKYLDRGFWKLDYQLKMNVIKDLGVGIISFILRNKISSFRNDHRFAMDVIKVYDREEKGPGNIDRILSTYTEGGPEEYFGDLIRLIQSIGKQEYIDYISKVANEDINLCKGILSLMEEYKLL